MHSWPSATGGKNSETPSVAALGEETALNFAKSKADQVAEKNPIISMV
jgi:hypothetical protein